MPELVKYDHDMVDVVDGDSLTSIVLNDGSLSITHSENGQMILTQSFECDVSDVLDKKQLESYYPDRLSIRVKAKNYTKGITNKTRFRENLGKLRSEGRMGEAAYLELHELIKDAHCPPVKLLERLIRLGHVTVAKDLDFYDEDPLLERSVDILQSYITHLGEPT